MRHTSEQRAGLVQDVISGTHGVALRLQSLSLNLKLNMVAAVVSGIGVAMTAMKTTCEGFQSLSTGSIVTR